MWLSVLFGYWFIVFIAFRCVQCH